MNKNFIGTLKVYDLRQANFLIQHDCKVLSANINYQTGNFYVKFERNSYFDEIMTKYSKMIKSEKSK